MSALFCPISMLYLHKVSYCMQILANITLFYLLLLRINNIKLCYLHYPIKTSIFPLAPDCEQCFSRGMANMAEQEQELSSNLDSEEDSISGKQLTFSAETTTNIYTSQWTLNLGWNCYKLCKKFVEFINIFRSSQAQGLLLIVCTGNYLSNPYNNFVIL